jgi:hypothetical protein
LNRRFKRKSRPPKHLLVCAMIQTQLDWNIKLLHEKSIDEHFETNE